jgi:hypothetical protein
VDLTGQLGQIGHDASDFGFARAIQLLRLRIKMIAGQRAFTLPTALRHHGKNRMVGLAIVALEGLGPRVIALGDQVGMLLD